MEDLKARLEELKTKQYMNESYFKKATEQYESLHGEIYEDILALEKQIADSEVTYSIGDRFTTKCAEYLLAEVGDGDDECLCMVNVKNGDGLDQPTIFAYGFDTTRISKADLFAIEEEEMIRIWDARLQQKVS
jgi:hypothetical protein